MKSSSLSSSSFPPFEPIRDESDNDQGDGDGLNDNGCKNDIIGIILHGNSNQITRRGVSRGRRCITIRSRLVSLTASSMVVSKFTSR